MRQKIIRTMFPLIVLVLSACLFTINFKVSAQSPSTSPAGNYVVMGLNSTSYNETFSSEGSGFFATPWTASASGELTTFSLLTNASGLNAYDIVAVYNGVYAGIQQYGSHITTPVSDAVTVNIPQSGTSQIQNVSISGNIVAGNTYWLLVYHSNSTLLISNNNLAGNGTGGSPTFFFRDATNGGDGTYTNGLNSSVFKNNFSTDSNITLTMDFSPWGSSGDNGYSPAAFTQNGYVLIDTSPSTSTTPTIAPTPTTLTETTLFYVAAILVILGSIIAIIIYIKRKKH